MTHNAFDTRSKLAPLAEPPTGFAWTGCPDCGVPIIKRIVEANRRCCVSVTTEGHSTPEHRSPEEADVSIAKQPTIANLIEDMEAIAGALRRQPQRERGHLWRAGETLAELLQRDALPNPALVNMLADGAITRRAYIDVSKAVIRGALPHLSIRFDYHALAARHGSHEAYARGLDKLAELARHRHQSRTAHHEGNLK